MMVAGLVKTMTAESANRAALGAGSIVMDVMSVDDDRPSFEKVRRIRSLRPDMILLAGGTDGGDKEHVLELAELIRSAEPKPRLGADYKLPLVFAGNKDARPFIEKMGRDYFALVMVDNLRPVLEVENTEPSRRAIHELFMEHVMSHAPGYNKLMKWTDIDIMPTPAGEGLAMQLIAKAYGKNVIGVGLGGATTNIYSVFDGKFVRSVSANLGMSYSVSNVMKEAGTENILRWLPFKLSDRDLRNRLMNKMIRPTTIPQTLEELIIEHAVAREALRLGLKHHKSIATRLKGTRQEHVDFSWMFDAALIESYIDMMKISIIAGTGGLLSHAPRRVQSLWALTDAFQPEGVTWLFQDSVFMMPHLGVLSTVYPEAAWQIFDKDCLVRMGTVIAPRGTGTEGQEVMTIELHMPNSETIKEDLRFGDVRHIPLPVGQEAKVLVTPKKGFDMGIEQGKVLEATAIGGEAGIILDARGRPVVLSQDEEERRKQILRWAQDLKIYPGEMLEVLIEQHEGA